MTIVDHAAHCPAALISARHALYGLAALLNSIDPAAWASLARPTAPQLAHLVWAIGGKLDQGLSDAGLAAPD
jgi:hypothetical protein